MQVYESVGDSLTGSIDGANTVYRTSLAFDADSLQVYVNGLLKVLQADFVDGADVVDATTIAMRTPLLPGDTLSVAYRPSGQGTLGGQPGGVPPLADVCFDAPPPLIYSSDVLEHERGATLMPPSFCAC